MGWWQELRTSSEHIVQPGAPFPREKRLYSVLPSSYLFFLDIEETYSPPAARCYRGIIQSQCLLVLIILTTPKLGGNEPWVRLILFTTNHIKDQITNYTFSFLLQFFFLSYFLTFLLSFFLSVFFLWDTLRQLSFLFIILFYTNFYSYFLDCPNQEHLCTC